MHRFILIFMLIILAAGCAPAPEAVTDLPPGDVAAGEALFHERLGTLPECSSCHTIDGTVGNGPTLLGFGAIAGTRVDGEDAVTYASNSIIRPGVYVMAGYSNLMPPSYSQHLNRQQLADLIAYILSL